MLKFKSNQSHRFHLVNVSPWPFFCGFSALMLTFGAVLCWHGYGTFLFKFGFLSLFLFMGLWWRDVDREGTIEGEHTLFVQHGLKIGMLLFILSEVMFFFGFFWAFFHSSFNPNPALGGVWPPAFIITLDPWKVPLLNTFFLLSSGASVTWAHHSIVCGLKYEAIIALLITIFLAIVFSLLQGYEYTSASFSISDSIYGSCFYMSTGFHGFHVLIGTFFLAVCLFRLYIDHFTCQHHIGFEAAAWYWHFVDVVWLFLFITIYWWGS